MPAALSSSGAGWGPLRWRRSCSVRWAGGLGWGACRRCCRPVRPCPPPCPGRRCRRAMGTAGRICHLRRGPGSCYVYGAGCYGVIVGGQVSFLPGLSTLSEAAPVRWCQLFSEPKELLWRAKSGKDHSSGSVVKEAYVPRVSRASVGGCVWELPSWPSRFGDEVWSSSGT